MKKNYNGLKDNDNFLFQDILSPLFGSSKDYNITEIMEEPYE